MCLWLRLVKNYNFLDNSTKMLYVRVMITPVTMTYSEARQNFTAVIRHCVDDCTPVVITSKKRKVVMLPYDEWESELETWHQKDTPANVEHLNQSISELERGEVISVSIKDLKSRIKAAAHA